MGNALHRCGPGANNADPFIGKARHQCTGRVTTRICVVPATGVKRVASKRVNARDAWQFGQMQWPSACAHILGTQHVATIGVHDVARERLVPGNRFDSGGKQCITPQIERVGDASRVGLNLRCWHIFCRGHGARFFKQWQIHHRRGIAHRARVTVPVPHAAHITGFVDESHIADACLFESRTDYQPSKTSADH